MQNTTLQPIEIKHPAGMTEADAIKSAYAAAAKELEQAINSGNYADVSRLSYALWALASKMAE